MSWLRSWKTVLGLLVVFAAGALFGAVGTLGAIRKEYRSRMDPTTWTPRTMTWLRDAGGLSPAQEDAIRPDVAAAVKKLAELKTSAEMERKGVLAEMFGEILPKLEPPQREKLTQAVKAAAAKAEALQGAGDRGQGSEIGSY